MTADKLFVGIGNPLRGDDAVGPLMAQQVRRRNLAGVQVITLSDNLDTLLHLWHERPLVVLADAVRAGARPGAVCCLDLLHTDLDGGSLRFSSHALNPIQVVKLGSVLGRLPHRLFLVGIEGKRFDLDTEMSEATTAALPQATAVALSLFGESDSTQRA